MEKKLLTVREACEYLSISKATLYKLIKKGKIKPVKIGKSTRLDKEDLDKLVETLKNES